MSHKVGMKYWNLLAKFHRNRSSINMGDMDTVKVLKNALCFIMGYLVSMEIRVTLILIAAFLYDTWHRSSNFFGDASDRYFDEEHFETNQNS